MLNGGTMSRLDYTTRNVDNLGALFTVVLCGRRYCSESSNFAKYNVMVLGLCVYGRITNYQASRLPCSGDDECSSQ